MQDFVRARRNMIDGQLRPNSVIDAAILAAFLETPREAFLPDALQAMAYADENLPVAGGRSILAPLVLGRLLQAAGPRTTDRVLLVGAATGYGCAIVSPLVREIVGLEASADLAAEARRNLAAARVGNVTIASGPFQDGWKAKAPYDLILVEGAMADVPDALSDQLSPEGRLVGVVATAARRGVARLYLKAAGSLSGRPLFDAAAPLLPGLERRAAFEFPH